MGWKQCGVGWEGLHGGADVGEKSASAGGAGKIFKIRVGVGRGGFKICRCRAGVDKKLQPVQNSSRHHEETIPVAPFAMAYKTMY